MSRLIPGFHVATIGSRFQYVIDGWPTTGSRRCLRCPSCPGTCRVPTGKPLALTFELVRNLAPAAFAIAMLGAIESLLSAVVADGMSGHRHDPDAELLARGRGT